jgi:hypothetical protein
MKEWWTYFIGNEDGVNQAEIIKGSGSFGDPIYLPGGGLGCL